MMFGEIADYVSSCYQLKPAIREGIKIFPIELEAQK
jgi:hypothetical protein